MVSDALSKAVTARYAYLHILYYCEQSELLICKGYNFFSFVSRKNRVPARVRNKRTLNEKHY